LKTIYEIPPLWEIQENPALLIEISQTGMTLCWTSNEKKQIEGIAVYGFEEGEPVVDQINAIVTKHPSHQINPNSVEICYNMPHTLLVPDEHYQENQDDAMLSLMFGSQFQDCKYTDRIAEKGIYNLYSVPETVDAILRKAFPLASYSHSNSKLIDHQVEGNELQCLISKDAVKFVLFKNSALHFIQQYPFNTPEDVVYHALNCCQQYNLSADETKLLLHGMIIADSQLYKQLYNYFIDIQFDQLPNQVRLASSLQDMPPHFFSHLIKLIS
jgi:hypothetical protein